MELYTNLVFGGIFGVLLDNVQAEYKRSVFLNLLSFAVEDSASKVKKSFLKVII
jgi:hypothetical protein